MAQKTSATRCWNLKILPVLKRCILKEPLKKILRNTDSITNCYIKQSLAPLTSHHSIGKLITIPAQRLLVLCEVFDWTKPQAWQTSYLGCTQLRQVAFQEALHSPNLLAWMDMKSDKSLRQTLCFIGSLSLDLSPANPNAAPCSASTDILSCTLYDRRYLNMTKKGHDNSVCEEY